MQDKLAIRMAVDADAAALAALRWRFRAEGGESSDMSIEDFRDCYTRFFRDGLAQGTRAHFVAEVDGELVAHVVVQRVPMVPRPKRIHDEWGYVTDNYTSPAFRNVGVGSMVLEAAIAWARAEELELLIVWPSDRAVTHYARAGFVRENDVMQLVLRDY